MSYVSAILGAISAIREILKMGISLWEAIREIKRKAKEDQALRGNESGSTIDIEQGLGNPDAGAPSGIGYIRDKKK